MNRAICAPLLLTGCLFFGSPGGGGDDDDDRGPRPHRGDAEALLNASVILPPGTTTLDDPPEDPDIGVQDPSSGVVAGVQPGDTLGIAIPYSAPDGDVVGAGIRFGDDGPIYSIPIPGAAGTTQGILAFEVQIPPDICDDLAQVCHDIRCYEFAVTSAGTVSAANINDIALMCNNCDEPSCQDLVTACNDQGCIQDFAASGGDYPETFIVDVGLSSGVADFAYDTLQQQDRVVIEHAGAIVHDSTCVGTNGWFQVTLPVQGTNLFTITVEPNCAGGYGTAWNLAASCAYTP